MSHEENKWQKMPSWFSNWLLPTHSLGLKWPLLTVTWQVGFLKNSDIFKSIGGISGSLRKRFIHRDE